MDTNGLALHPHCGTCRRSSEMGLSGFSVNVRSTQKRSINIYNADDNEVSGSESAIRYVKLFPFVMVGVSVGTE